MALSFIQTSGRGRRAGLWFLQRLIAPSVTVPFTLHRRGTREFASKAQGVHCEIIGTTSEGSQAMLTRLDKVLRLGNGQGVTHQSPRRQPWTPWGHQGASCWKNPKVTAVASKPSRRWLNATNV